MIKIEVGGFLRELGEHGRGGAVEDAGCVEQRVRSMPPVGSTMRSSPSSA
jgi:hypothetical protein